MKNKIWIFVLMLSLAMNVGVATMFGLRFVQIKNADNSNRCPLVAKDTYLFTLLDLSQKQLALITPLAYDFHEELGKMSSEVHEKRNAMIAMMEQEPIASDQVNRIRQEIAVLQSTIQQRVFEHILKMKEILSQEQKQVFFKALRQRFLTQNLNCNE